MTAVAMSFDSSVVILGPIPPAHVSSLSLIIKFILCMLRLLCYCFLGSDVSSADEPDAKRLRSGG